MSQLEDNLYDLRLRLLSDPINRKIIDYLIESPRYPDDMARVLGFTRSALEQRLAKLIEAGFSRKVTDQSTQRVLILVTSEGKNLRKEISELYLQIFTKASSQKLPSEENVIPYARKILLNKILSGLSIPLLVFVLFESIAIINTYNNFVIGNMYWVLVGWLFWTIFGIIVAMLSEKLIKKVT